MLTKWQTNCLTHLASRHHLNFKIQIREEVPKQQQSSPWLNSADHSLFAIMNYEWRANHHDNNIAALIWTMLKLPVER